MKGMEISRREIFQEQDLGQFIARRRYLPRKRERAEISQLLERQFLRMMIHIG